MHENEIATIILDEAFAVHTHYGPGIFERVYESALEGRLRRRGLSVLRQYTVHISDEYVQDEPGFILDLLVGGYDPCVHLRPLRAIFHAVYAEFSRRFATSAGPTRCEPLRTFAPPACSHSRVKGNRYLGLEPIK